MSWYELLLTLHILSAALYLGSAAAITAMSYLTIRGDRRAFGAFAAPATWWAGRAHPAAALVILLAGGAMVADAGLSFGETWIALGLAGWLLLTGISSALTGKTATQLTAAIAASGGTLTEQQLPLARRLLLAMRIELVILVLVITDMVAKPR